MAVNNYDGFIKIPGAVAITPGLLVDAAGALVNGASVTKKHVGLSMESTALGALTTLVNPSGKVLRVQANVAIGANVPVYYDANGRIGVTSASNTQIGVSLEAASGAGSLIAVSFL